MSLPIDVSQEMTLAETEQSNVLKQNVNQLSNEVDRLRNELSSARNDNAGIGREARSPSEIDEDKADLGEDLPECLEPQFTDAGHLYKNLQTALQDYNMRIQSDLVAANENDRELRAANEQLQSQLDAAYDKIKELSDLNGELQMAQDDADKPEASGDGDYIQWLENRLEELQLDLDTAHRSNQELEEKTKLREDQLEYVAEGNWENMRPFLDEKLRKCCADFKAELGSCRAELSKVESDLSEPDSANLREENRALKEDLKSMSAAPKIDAQKKKKRRRKAAAKTKMSPGESELLKLQDRDSVHVSSGW